MALHLGLGIPERCHTLLTTYETTEPPIDRRYLFCGGTLQNVGSHPLTGDIRFTERTMTDTFQYARPRISHVRYYRDTEPLKKHVCYLMCSSLTERRNQPVTGDIRFTVGKTTFKGGRTFLSVTARISLYVTAYITNCSRLYQRIWLLPRMYWYVLYGTLEVIRLQVTSNSLNVP